MKKCFVGITSTVTILITMFSFSWLPANAQSGLSSLTETSSGTMQLQEDSSLRTACSKTFRTGTNEYLACIYSDPIHFLNSAGNWIEIDNSLVISSDFSVLNSTSDKKAEGIKEGSPIYYENRANSFSVSLPYNLSSTEPIILKNKDYILHFTVRDIQPSTAQIISVPDDLAPTTSDSAKLDSVETTLQNQRSRLSYLLVQPNISLQYDLYGQTLKESLIFNTVPTQENFSFNLTYTGLYPEVQNTGEIRFYENDTRDGEPVFIIDAPYMFDSAGGYSNAVTMHFTPTSFGAVYTIIPDRNWLQDKSRVYPITLDPTITTSTAQTSIEDNSVHESDPDLNYRDADRLYVGNAKLSSGNYESRTYIRFPRISTIPTTAFIVQADMRLNHHSNTSYQSASDNIIDIYDVGNNNWDTDTITWNSQSTYTFGNLIYSRHTDKTYTEEKSDITSLVRLWYATTASNNGLVIMPRNIDSEGSNRTAYYSSDCSSSLSSLRPRVTIKYYTMASLSNGTYFARNRGSGQYANILYDSTIEGTVAQSNFDGSASSMWQITRESDGYYTFSSLDSGMFLGVSGYEVEQYTSSIENATRFGIYSVGVDGVYIITSMEGVRYGQVLAVPTPQAEITGTPLCQTLYTDNTIYTDQWCLGPFIPNVPCVLFATESHSCIPVAITHLAGYWSQNGYFGFNANNSMQIQQRVTEVISAMSDVYANDSIPEGFGIFTHSSGNTTYRLQCNNSWQTNWTLMMDQINEGKPFLLGFAETVYGGGHMTVCVGYEMEGSVRRVFVSDSHNLTYAVQPYDTTENNFMSTVSVVSE